MLRTTALVVQAINLEFRFITQKHITVDNSMELDELQQLISLEKNIEIN